MSIIRFKVTVRPDKIQPELVLAIVIVHSIFSSHGYDCIITSLNDSSHGENSLHFKGKGVDFRTKHIQTNATKKIIIREIINNLTFNGYDVIFESEGKDNEHLHVEYDPKEEPIHA